MRLGVLLKHRETHGRIVSFDQLRLGAEEQLLIFSLCVSPRRVKTFQRFVNSHRKYTTSLFYLMVWN